MTITELFWIAIVSGIFGILGSLITSGLQLFKWTNGEKKKLNSDSANSIAEAATELIAPFREEVSKLRIENSSLMKRLEETEKMWNDRFNALRTEYTEIQRELSIFKNWAERLVYQIYSLGKEPVPMILDVDDNNKQ